MKGKKGKTLKIDRTSLVNIQEFSKGENDNIEQCDCAKLDEMFGHFYVHMDLRSSSLLVKNCLT